jgi:DNA invertase Pin-like site-specific DNA recombinase
MRSAIYARFSSELQDSRSITDQVTLATKYCQSRGFSIVQSFEDAGISGASVANRPALQSLIREAGNSASVTPESCYCTSGCGGVQQLWQYWPAVRFLA